MGIFNSSQLAEVTRVSTRVAYEAIRHAARGDGGLALPVPVKRPGTVGSDALPGATLMVRADGDFDAVQALNATGNSLGAGARVLIEWQPPHGIYVTQVLVGRRLFYDPSVVQAAALTHDNFGSSYDVVNGARVLGQVTVVITQTGAVNNPVLFTLPLPHALNANTAIGSWWYVDAGNNNFAGTLYVPNTGSDSTVALIQDATAQPWFTHPFFATANGDILTASFQYPWYRPDPA